MAGRNDQRPGPRMGRSARRSSQKSGPRLARWPRAATRQRHAKMPSDRYPSRPVLPSVFPVRAYARPNLVGRASGARRVSRGPSPFLAPRPQIGCLLCVRHPGCEQPGLPAFGQEMDRTEELVRERRKLAKATRERLTNAMRCVGSPVLCQTFTSGHSATRPLASASAGQSRLVRTRRLGAAKDQTGGTATDAIHR